MVRYRRTLQDWIVASAILVQKPATCVRLRGEDDDHSLSEARSTCSRNLGIIEGTFRNVLTTISSKVLILDFYNVTERD